LLPFYQGYQCSLLAIVTWMRQSFDILFNSNVGLFLLTSSLSNQPRGNLSSVNFSRRWFARGGMFAVRTRRLVQYKLNTIPCSLPQRKRNCTAICQKVWRLHRNFVRHLKWNYAAISQRSCNFVSITAYFSHVYL
jgi:hypothetical protein